MQLGPMAGTFRACAEIVPVDDLVEGDFYVNNDPYAGGQHLQDIFIYSPIFFAGRVIGFAGTVAHHLDLGGGNPGLTSTAVDIHAEGLIIPPSRYSMARDWNGGPLERLVAKNVRVPPSDHWRLQRPIRRQRHRRPPGGPTLRQVRGRDHRGDNGRVDGLFGTPIPGPPCARFPTASTSARTRWTTTGSAKPRSTSRPR